MRPNRGFILLLLNGTACLVRKECAQLFDASSRLYPTHHPCVGSARAAKTSRFESKRARKLIGFLTGRRERQTDRRPVPAVPAHVDAFEGVLDQISANNSHRGAHARPDPRRGSQRTSGAAARIGALRSTRPARTEFLITESL